MKLLPYGNKGSERPALLIKAGKLRDLSGVISDAAGSIESERIRSRRAIYVLGPLQLRCPATIELRLC
jgi:hypothetical protein